MRSPPTRPKPWPRRPSPSRRPATLSRSINDAAAGLSKLSRNAEHLDEFLKTWITTGTNVSAASQSIDSLVKANENDFRATLANLKKLGDKLNDTLSSETQDSLKTGIARFSSASARMDAELTDVAPLLKDLGAP